MYDKKANVPVESLEEAKARGVQVTKCPSIPAKGQRETQKAYNKRVKAAIKIDDSHIPDDLKHIVASIRK